MSAHPKIRVLLSDTFPLYVQGMRSAVAGQSGVEVVADALDASTLWRLARELRPSVVVLDLSLASVGGTVAIAELKRLDSAMRFLLMAPAEDRSLVRALMSAGASGCVLKRSPCQEFLRALRTVAGGGVYIDSHLAGTLSGPSAGSSKGAGAVRNGTAPRLTSREEEVMRLISQGFSNKEIGTRLDRSVKTIETHKKRALEKLHLRTRSDIVRHALENGWLGAPSR